MKGHLGGMGGAKVAEDQDPRVSYPPFTQKPWSDMLRGVAWSGPWQELSGEGGNSWERQRKPQGSPQLGR